MYNAIEAAKPITNSKTLVKISRKLKGRKEVNRRFYNEYSTFTERIHGLLSHLMKTHTWPSLGATTIRSYYLKYDRAEYKKLINGIKYHNLDRQRSSAKYRGLPQY